MLKNYLKIAFRSLKKNKLHAVINIVGLAAGMAVAMLIGLWIRDEVSFDNYHRRHKQLAQIMTTFFNDKNEASTAAAVAIPLGAELKTKYAGDFENVSMASWNYDHTLEAGEKKITAKGMWVETNFPSMFSLRMLNGNINALDDPSSVLLSSSLAKTLFGNTNPVGQRVKFDNSDDFDVAGVFEDLPQNTTLRDVKLLLPWKKYITLAWIKDAQSGWGSLSSQAFVQISKNGDIDKISKKIEPVQTAHQSASFKGKLSLLLHPMDKWRLYNEFKNGQATDGRIQFIRLFAIIGISILLLACINFMNLSTARSEKRAKEVGIRKTIGSGKTQLVAQFLSESTLVALASFILSVLFVILLLPMFNKLADKNMQLPWSNILFWLVAILFTLVTGLISGSYPAFYLSKFKPIKVLKGTFRAGQFASLPRKILVVLQFTFSIALIIGTIVIFKQIRFAKNRPVNYSKEGLITIPMSTPDLYGHYDAVRTDLLATGVVSNMAESSSSTTLVNSTSTAFNWPGKNPNSLHSFGITAVTTDFGNTIGWQMKEGRDFSKDFATDSASIIINESAVKQIGMEKDIPGQTIQYQQKNYTVVGIIKDMITESPYQQIRPAVFFNDLNNCNTITIKIKQGIPIQDALSKIATVYKKYNAPFDVTFNDEEYAKKFSDEQRVANLSTFFTLLAIFISCLGLFGLASFVAEQRKKDIGVRKLLGATVFNLWQMQLKEFTLLVSISCFVAIPLAWYYLYHWLENYNYRTEITWWVFFISCSGALLITLLTVSFQAIKAATTNPVKSLRTE